MGKIKGKNAYDFAKRAREKDFTDMMESDILPLLNLNKRTRVVDFGTGSGNIIPFFIEKVKSFTAVEPSPEMVKIMEKEYGGYKNLNIVSAPADNTPLDSTSFDIVITKFALHHIRDTQKVFSEAKRVLKDNGQFVIIDMMFNSNPLIKIIEPFWKIKKAWELGSHELNCVYRSNSYFEKVIKLNGFKIKHKKKIKGKRTYRDKHYPAYIYIMEKSPHLL